MNALVARCLCRLFAHMPYEKYTTIGKYYIYFIIAMTSLKHSTEIIGEGPTKKKFSSLS